MATRWKTHQSIAYAPGTRSSYSPLKMAESTESALMSVRARAAYSSAEREFSLLLKRSLDDLLQGKRNRLDILRKYPSDAGRLGIIPTPGEFPLAALRLPTTAGC